MVQGLMEMGARKIAVVGLPPIGCVPAVISLNSDNALTDRGCIQRLSTVARDYNRLLQTKLAALQRRSPGATLVYMDIYNPIDHMVNNPQKYGTSLFSFSFFFPNKKKKNWIYFFFRIRKCELGVLWEWNDRVLGSVQFVQLGLLRWFKISVLGRRTPNSSRLLLCFYGPPPPNWSVRQQLLVNSLLLFFLIIL